MVGCCKRTVPPKFKITKVARHSSSDQPPKFSDAQPKYPRRALCAAVGTVSSKVNAPAPQSKPLLLVDTLFS
jgi:hypothetical protein